MMHKEHVVKPKMAVLDPNILTVIGLRRILQDVMPIMEVVAFSSLTELKMDDPDGYVHFFVNINIFIQDRQFFEQHAKKTIVLTSTYEQGLQLGGINTLCVNVSEREFVHSFLLLHQRGHSQGHHLPNMPSLGRKVLTAREVEVLVKVVEGYINKEIADLLNISITTVISHRKNITEKLGIKSVSGLTIYAVMNGYVDVNRI